MTCDCILDTFVPNASSNSPARKLKRNAKAAFNVTSNRCARRLNINTKATSNKSYPSKRRKTNSKPNDQLKVLRSKSNRVPCGKASIMAKTNISKSPLVIRPIKLGIRNDEEYKAYWVKRDKELHEIQKAVIERDKNKYKGCPWFDEYCRRIDPDYGLQKDRSDDLQQDDALHPPLRLRGGGPSLEGTTFNDECMEPAEQSGLTTNSDNTESPLLSEVNDSIESVEQLGPTTRSDTESLLLREVNDIYYPEPCLPALLQFTQDEKNEVDPSKEHFSHSIAAQRYLLPNNKFHQKFVAAKTEFAGYSIRNRNVLETTLCIPDNELTPMSSSPSDSSVKHGPSPHISLLESTCSLLSQHIFSDSGSCSILPLKEFALSETDSIELLDLSVDESIKVIFMPNISEKNGSDYSQYYKDSVSFMKNIFSGDRNTSNSITTKKCEFSNLHALAVALVPEEENVKTYMFLSLVLFRTPGQIHDTSSNIDFNIPALHLNDTDLPSDGKLKYPLMNPTVIHWIGTKDIIRESCLGTKLVHLVSCIHYLYFKNWSVYLLVDILEQSTVRFYRRLGFKQLKLLKVMDDDLPMFTEHFPGSFLQSMETYISSNSYVYGRSIVPLHISHFPHIHKNSFMMSLVRSARHIVRGFNLHQDKSLHEEQCLQKNIFVTKELKHLFCNQYVFPLFDDMHSAHPDGLMFNQFESVVDQTLKNNKENWINEFQDIIALSSRFPLVWILNPLNKQLRSTVKEKNNRLKYNLRGYEVELVKDISWCWYLPTNYPVTPCANIFCELCGDFLLKKNEDGDSAKDVPFDVIRALSPYIIELHYGCDFGGLECYNRLMNNMPETVDQDEVHVTNQEESSDTSADGNKNPLHNRRKSRRGEPSSLGATFPTEEETNGNMKKNDSFGNYTYLGNNHKKGLQILWEESVKKFGIKAEVGLCCECDGHNLRKQRSLLDAVRGDIHFGLESDSFAVQSAMWTQQIFKFFFSTFTNSKDLLKYIIPSRKDRDAQNNLETSEMKELHADVDRLNQSFAFIGMKRVFDCYTLLLRFIVKYGEDDFLRLVPHFQITFPCTPSQYLFFKTDFGYMNRRIKEIYPHVKITGLMLFSYWDHYLQQCTQDTTKIIDHATFCNPDFIRKIKCDRSGQPTLTTELAQRWERLGGPWKVLSKTVSQKRHCEKMLRLSDSTDDMYLCLTKSLDQDTADDVYRDSQQRWDSFAQNKLPPHFITSTDAQFLSQMNREDFESEPSSDSCIIFKPHEWLNMHHADIWDINNLPPPPDDYPILVGSGWDDLEAVRKLGEYFVNHLPTNHDFTYVCPIGESSRAQKIQDLLWSDHDRIRIKGVKNLSQFVSDINMTRDDQLKLDKYLAQAHLSRYQHNIENLPDGEEKSDMVYAKNSVHFLIKIFLDESQYNILTEFMVDPSTFETADGEEVYSDVLLGRWELRCFREKQQTKRIVVFVADFWFLHHLSIDFLIELNETNKEGKWQELELSVVEHLRAVKKWRPRVLTSVELVSCFPRPVFKVCYETDGNKRKAPIYQYTSFFEQNLLWDDRDSFGRCFISKLLAVGQGLVHHLGTGSSYGSRDDKIDHPPQNDSVYFDLIPFRGKSCSIAGFVNIAYLFNCHGLVQKLRLMSSSSLESPTFNTCMNAVQPVFHFKRLPPNTSCRKDCGWVFSHIKNCHLETGCPIIVIVKGSIHNTNSHVIVIHMDQILDCSRGRSYLFTESNFDWAMGVNLIVRDLVDGYFVIPQNNLQPKMLGDQIFHFRRDIIDSMTAERRFEYRKQNKRKKKLLELDQKSSVQATKIEKKRKRLSDRQLEKRKEYKRRKQRIKRQRKVMRK